MSYLIAVLVALVLLVIVAFVVFPWLAKENVLFTTVKEGTVKAIMRGKSFDRFILRFAGYHLNDPKQSEKPWYKPDRAEWQVVYHGSGNKSGFSGDETKDDHYDDRSWLLKHLGLYWVGWPWANSVYVYQFEWNETYTEKEEGTEKVLPRAEATDFIYVADFTYAIVTEGAETKDRLPTNELTLVTVAIRNPYRALFSGEDWMRRITAAINRHVRNFVGDRDFQELISSKKENWTDFSQPVIKLTEELSDDLPKDDPKTKPPYGLQGRYGVEIRTADLQTIDLSGVAKKEHQEATTREYVARQDAKATLLTGQAGADVIKMRGDKEAEALSARLAVIKEHGVTGIALAGYDAVVESSKGPGKTIIWGNNPLGPLAEMLKPGTKGEKT